MSRLNGAYGLCNTILYQLEISTPNPDTRFWGPWRALPGHIYTNRTDARYNRRRVHQTSSNNTMLPALLECRCRIAVFRRARK